VKYQMLSTANASPTPFVREAVNSNPVRSKFVTVLMSLAPVSLFEPVGFDRYIYIEQHECRNARETG
jgi:hypothetical protein